MSDNNEDVYDLYGKKIKLTPEQEKTRSHKVDGKQQVIKGVAGSGKSLVLLSKAQKLSSQQTLDIRENDIIFFGFNNTLVQYAKEYLDPNGQKKAYLNICTVDQHLANILKDESMRGLPDYPYQRTINVADRKQLIEDILSVHSRTEPNNKLLKNEKKWEEEIMWALDNGVSDDDEGRDRYLKELSRRGCSSAIGRDLNKAYGIICEYIHRLRECDLTEWSLKYLFLERNVKSIPSEYRYNHVLVDEAQDLSLVKIRVVKSLFNVDLAIAMDANQRIYKNHWRMKDIGIPTFTDRLNKPFRCTKQIDDLAECIRKKNDKELETDDIPEHISPADSGELPKILKCLDTSDEKARILSLIKKISEDERMNVAVLFRTNKDLEDFANYLVENRMRYEIIKGKSEDNGYTIRTPGIKLSVVNSAKGLEFHNVIIPYFDDMFIHYNASDDTTNNNRNLLYVAMTRARIRLFLTYSGTPSGFLSEMDSKMYELIKRED